MSSRIRSFSKYILVIVALVSFSSCKEVEEAPSDVSKFHEYVLKNDFGLCGGELSLTIDDGPYDFTLKWLNTLLSREFLRRFS